MKGERIVGLASAVSVLAIIGSLIVTIYLFNEIDILHYEIINGMNDFKVIYKAIVIALKWSSTPITTETIKH